jgi:hypothetical protein
MNHRLAGNVQMPFMRRIEGAAKDADAAAGEGRGQNRARNPSLRA